jgi:hypothetical protein
MLNQGALSTFLLSKLLLSKYFRKVGRPTQSSFPLRSIHGVTVQTFDFARIEDYDCSEVLACYSVG